jgi:hypothetical protein
VEHLCDLKLINFKGDKVEEKGWRTRNP